MQFDKISFKNVRETAYKSLVRPILEYASTVLDPATQIDIDRLEAVQRRAARFVSNRYHNLSSVADMLESLQWPTLERRRKYSRLIMLKKIREVEVQCPTILDKLEPAPVRARRGHDKQLKLLPTRTQYRSTSFLPRTIKEWNALPPDIVEAQTTNAFVSRLRAQ